MFTLMLVHANRQSIIGTYATMAEARRARLEYADGDTFVCDQRGRFWRFVIREE